MSSSVTGEGTPGQQEAGGSHVLKKSFHLLLLRVQAKLGESGWQHQGFSLPVCLFISSFACSFSKHIFTIHYVTCANLGADERRGK